MSDLGEPGGDSTPSVGEGGGFTGFLTSLRGVIASIAALVIAISGLLTALKAVGVFDGGSDDPKPLTQTVGGSLFTGGPVRYGHVSVEGASVSVTASRRGRPVVHLANVKEDRGDVSLSARIERTGGSDDYGAGLVCRHRSAANYYVFSVLSGGRYRILRYRDGKAAVLSSGERVAAIRDGANDVTASCLGEGPTRLRLVVNGLTVGRADDADGIADGGVGIRVGTSEPPVTCRFGDFVVR
jgi:hypothetical protein